MKTFLKTQIQLIAQEVLFTVILFFVHNSIINNFLPKVNLILPLYRIYLFHFVVTTIIIVFINYKLFKGDTTVFNLFILFTLVKMLLAVVLLLPVFLSDLKNKNYDVFNFFMPYFVYLAFEVFSTSKLLQK